MPVSSNSNKHVIVHVGPHRTGTTAIQTCFSENIDALQKVGINFIHSKETQNIALALANEAFEEADLGLRAISKRILLGREPVTIISQEDFCGHLPGRSRRKAIYPRLTKNLRLIKRALEPNRVSFVFFARNPTEWLRSCYFQHLRYRTQFSSWDAFRSHFGPPPNWESKLERAQQAFGKSFHVLQYTSAPDAGVKEIVKLAQVDEACLEVKPQTVNRSPTGRIVQDLEQINALSAFKDTAWFSKSLIQANWKPRIPASPSWRAPNSDFSLTSVAFPEMSPRIKSRIPVQDVEDILPDEDVDLVELAGRILPAEANLVTESRSDIRVQSQILSYHFRGRSELVKLLALAISYLRRNTSHNIKAKMLFHRIWEELGPRVVNELSTRWLISTLQTFADHGKSDDQRVIGVSGYFYANLMKIYETERSLEGLPQDGVIKNLSPQTPSKFTGLDRFSVGGSDLLLNTNVLALDLASRDDVAGLVLHEFLLRVKVSGNAFSRFDRTRMARGVEIPGFEDTWSFFSPPKYSF